ncbi:polysaccharide deacetylase family protein [Candidatus Gottesmanbacteria bacterium]|nr:polysaccharide deacetylase family protein [Candidatus Gottesmanbacteria bacterium]
MKHGFHLTAAIGGFLLLMATITLALTFRTQSTRPKLVPTASFSHVPNTAKTPQPTPKQPATASAQLMLPPVVVGERAYAVPILLYHYISVNANKDDKTRTTLSTPPVIFEQQLQLLQSHGFATITLDELAAALDGKITLPAKSVMLTFDDGYADFYANAVPLLRKYGMRGIAFIPTGLIGGGNYMTWGQIEELAKTPNVIFAAHSIHHWALTNVSAKVLQQEVSESKRVLEGHVGYRVNWFAYPYGVFNDAVVAAVRNAGFVGSATTLSGSWQYQSRLFYIPRYRAGTRTGASFLKLVE